LDNIAQKEVDYILEIGGIQIKPKVQMGIDFTLDTLRDEYDAVFIGIGLPGVNPFKIKGEDVDGVVDAVDYIRDLRQAKRLSELPVGDKVVVIGGGMTAIDIAVQSKKLGASEVTIAYRRDKASMKASGHEQRYAQINDVKLRYFSSPKTVLSRDGRVTGIEFDITEPDDGGKFSITGKTYRLDADVIFKAIGQKLPEDKLGESAGKLAMLNGRIAVDDNRKTSVEGVWAGGDCIAGGEDLTVSAVRDGKLAAQSIHDYLQS
jgi:dihydropyrimidine dehydrogenase (NAD+) subunit PreT